MFGNQKRVDTLKGRIKELEEERDQLSDDVAELRITLATKNAEWARKDEDIKHTVKMKNEQLEIDKKKYEVKCDGEKDAAIAKVKDEYRDKLESRLEGEVTRIKEMYSEILERLPTMTVSRKEISKE